MGTVEDEMGNRFLAYNTVFCIAQFAITINSNVCPHIRVPNMLTRESYA